jgi:hypothetical protein
MRQPAGIDRVEAVDVLVRVDRSDHLVAVAVERRRQRELDENAVDRRIVVERGDQRHQLRLRRVGRQGMLDRMEAELLGLPRLRPDIDLARRVLADQHHREAGDDVGLLLEADRLLADPVGDPRRDGLAVDDPSGRRPFARH